MLTSSSKHYLFSIRALTTHGLSERKALHGSGSLPNTDEGAAIASSLADLGWIITRTVEDFDLDRAELHTLMSLTTDTVDFDPESSADLLLKLSDLDAQRSEDSEAADPRMLERLMAKMATMPQVSRLILYRLLTQAQCSTDADPDTALKAVGLMQ